MTKGEIRKARKLARAEGRPLTDELMIEHNSDGGLELVRARTQCEEYAHRRAMERWARENYDTDGANES